MGTGFSLGVRRFWLHNTWLCSVHLLRRGGPPAVFSAQFAERQNSTEAGKAGILTCKNVLNMHHFPLKHEFVLWTSENPP
jgi:hypothetical protein